MRADSLGQSTIGWQDQVLSFYLRSLLNQTYGQPEPLVAERTEQDSITTFQPAQAAPPALPGWAQPEFQVVYFRVGHMVVAAPLAGVRRIERLNDSSRVTVLPGKPDWFLGLVRFQGEIIQLADTELLISGKSSTSTRSSYRHALLLDEGRWGLVCDEIVDMVRLRESDVRWRVNQSKRVWAAGTVINRLCVLMDPDRLIPGTQSNDKRIWRHRRP
ncbi:chemotaxis protein CheW [Methylocaldum sp.]|uniref:chemotaxis protein CheW n=1 Tax=Methylocaldum sp. TaxID=1969727 RepID=UPI002D5C029F|nr:chemotaxis protein CheW [Methylocaldum sp.]HYE36805.1 chemotaxis protein CheW [Methylocaldum sp.]